MTKTIVQTASFAAKPEKLYSLYAEEKKHSAATGGQAIVSAKAGSAFSAFDGTLLGKTLGAIPGRLFVQTWRGDDWSADEEDSILTLVFDKGPGLGRVSMVHANIPERHYEGIKTGWTTYYWAPWRRYLARTKTKSRS